MVSFKSTATTVPTLLVSFLRPCLALPASPGAIPNLHENALVRRGGPSLPDLNADAGSGSRIHLNLARQLGEETNEAIADEDIRPEEDTEVEAEAEPSTASAVEEAPEPSPETSNVEDNEDIAETPTSDASSTTETPSGSAQPEGEENAEESSSGTEGAEGIVSSSTNEAPSGSAAPGVQENAEDNAESFSVTEVAESTAVSSTAEAPSESAAPEGEGNADNAEESSSEMDPEAEESSTGADPENTSTETAEGEETGLESSSETETGEASAGTEPENTSTGTEAKETSASESTSEDPTGTETAESEETSQDVPDPVPSNGTSSNDTATGDWLCGDGSISGWSTDLWNEHNVGRWLVQTTETYAGKGGSWPANGNEKGEDNMGVPRTIALYDGEDRDNAFTWPGTGCITSTETCDLDDDQLLNDNCAKFPERAFSLWAMRNYARLMQSWLRNFEEGVSTAQQFTGEIIDTFLFWDKSADSPPSGELTTMVGAITTIGAFAPHAKIVAGISGLGGAMIMGSGAITMLDRKPVRDPRFDSFADFQSSLGAIKENVEDAITAYFNKLFVDVPVAGDSDGGTELARVLESGSFADQDVGGGADAVRPNDMARMMKAAMISEAWNGGHVAIVKWSKDGAMAKDKWNPCGDGDKNHKSHMEQSLACVLDMNYMILPMMVNGLSGKDRGTILENNINVGQDQETLGKYDLTQEMVILAAERTQKRTGQFIYKGLDDIDNMFKDVVENPGPNNDLGEDLLFFNTPVCDLDTIDKLEWDRCGNERGGKMFSRCITQYLAHWCSWMQIDKGSDVWFPYQLKAVVEGTASGVGP